MNLPLISVCIPTYNGHKYLKECLDSVIAQSYLNVEIIIVDDVSTDATVTIVNSYLQRDRRISFYRNETNLGLVANWNRCLELAKGEWIKFVFQDDIIEKNCIELMQAAANNHPFVACNRHFIFDENVDDGLKHYFNHKLLTLEEIVKNKSNLLISDKRISKIVAKNFALNFIGEPTAVMFKKNIVSEVGIFNAEISQLCDLEYWQRIGSLHGLVYMPQKLISFRVHQHSASTINKSEQNKFKAAYADAVIIAYELLYGNKFIEFRKKINSIEKLFLHLSLKLKLYEAKMELKKFDSVNKKYFESLLANRPELSGYNNASLVTIVLYQILVLKRKLFS